MSYNSHTVLFIEPYITIRQALTRIINELASFTIRWQADDAAQGLELEAEHGPDITLIDMDLAGPSGLSVLYELRKRGSTTRPIVISRVTDKTLARRCLSAGAYSYLAHQTSLEELEMALLKAANDERFIPSELDSLADEIEVIPQGEQHNGYTQDPLEVLSKREREIFFKLAQGEQNSAIAKELFISPRTVETHRARVVRKLGLRSNAELIRFAIRNGLSVA